MIARVFLLVSAVLVVAACGPAPSDDAGTQPESSTETAAKVSPPVTSTLLSSDRETLATCSPEVAKISWDVSQQHPNVTNVQIFAGPDSEPVLFSSGGATGSVETGAWTKPGTIFRLRDGASGEELSRIVIGGPACG